MSELLIGFIVAAILLIAEYLLCTKLESPLWGGIIPALILVGTICLFASGRIPLETRYLFPFVILNTLFFGDWGTGRDKYRKIKQAEMERMKAKDIVAHPKCISSTHSMPFAKLPCYSSFALTVELYPISGKKFKLIFKPSHCMK
ncbi:hypothetical protein [Lachnoclostridium sp. An169]|uniref:hypothetical protein n=1 Tax=Lachnoclostridium sp. An169 TaxID=1965569 RepID=UPI0017487F76|nr:hypothetical protein [Lachnoclostridium sp. An169]